MATRTATLKIAIDGEKEYKQRIAEINRENKTLGEEMKKLAAEYKGNEQSVEALTKKQSLLDRQLLEQQAKVEDTRKQLQSWRDALEKVREEQGANSAEYREAQKKVQEYEAALARAETQEIKLQNSIEDTGKALENQGKITFTVGDAVDKLAKKVGINLPQELTKGLNSGVSFSTGTVAAFGAVTAAATVLYKAVSEVVTKLNEMTLAAAGKADDLLTRSITSGLSTRDLQAFEYASPYIEVDASTLEGAFSRMPKVISQAQDQLESYRRAQEQAAASGKAMTTELGSQAAAFETLGISLTDGSGNLRDYHDLTWEALEALGQMGDTTEAAALANDIFGKSYAELKPLMQNAEEAQRLMNEAVEQGYVLSEEQLQILGEVDDAHQHLTQTQEMEANKIATQWAPAIKEAYETQATLTKLAGDALVESGLIENTAMLISNTLKLVEGGAELASRIPSWLNPIKNLSNQFEVLGKTIRGVLDLLGLANNTMAGHGGLGSDIAGATWQDDVQAWVSAGGTIIGDWNYNDFDKTTGKLTTTIQSGYTGDVASYGHMSEDQLRRLMGYNASGNDNWRGGLTYLNEAGPEAVFLPSGSQILSAQETRMLGAGGNTYNINVQNVEELQQLLDLLDGLRVRRRMG